jgi:hypothetical protein
VSAHRTAAKLARATAHVVEFSPTPSGRADVRLTRSNFGVSSSYRFTTECLSIAPGGKRITATFGGKSINNHKQKQYFTMEFYGRAEARIEHLSFYASFRVTLREFYLTLESGGDDGCESFKKKLSLAECQ